MLTDRSTGWKNEKKMHVDSKVSVKIEGKEVETEERETKNTLTDHQTEGNSSGHCQ